MISRLSKGILNDFPIVFYPVESQIICVMVVMCASCFIIVGCP